MSREARRPVSRQSLWLLGVALGIATVLASALALMASIVVVLLVVPFARRPGGLALVAGMLTGFGGLWLLLIVGESSSAGAPDNTPFWAAVGAVPLAVGLALAARTLLADGGAELIG